MRKLMFLLVFGLVIMGLNPSQVLAACGYSSTQARVQRDVSQPWSEAISVGQGESFRVGSFHDGSGQFAGDTRLKIYEPNGNQRYYGNAGTVQASQPGTYWLLVTTANQSGGACEQWARVSVVPSNQCTYRSTEARVQKDITQDWTDYLEINLGEGFNVGSFHNGVDRFVGDTRLTVYGPNGWSNVYGNGGRLIPGAVGDYVLRVETYNQTGSACVAEAKVRVKPALSCRYGSTQARVQRDIRDPWKGYLEINRGDSFNVGSFHDHTGVFASDTRLSIVGPGIDTTRRNGGTVWVYRPGVYTLSVVTNGQGGVACEQTASVRVR